MRPKADRSGGIRGSPKRCGSVCARLSGCGSALSRTGWRRRCRPGRARGFTRARWRGNGRQGGWLGPAAGPPEGKQRWTLRLLAERRVELEVVPELSHETGRQAVKKECGQAASAADV